MGATDGAAELKVHPWFQDINWEDIQNKKVKAPYIPLLEGDGDLKHFSTQFTEKPLSPADAKSIKETGVEYEGFSYEAELQIENHDNNKDMEM
jgi:hypothetical protein